MNTVKIAAILAFALAGAFGTVVTSGTPSNTAGTGSPIVVAACDAGCSDGGL